MATMFDIDKAAQAYSQAHDALRDEMRHVEAAIAKIKEAHHKALRKLVAQAADKKNALKDLIEESRDQFEKPKTRVLHGVKLGLQKGKGKLIIENEDRTLKLIAANYTEDEIEAMGLIRVYEEPDKDALNKLDAKALRTIGVKIEDTGDQVVIKPTDSEIDKLVDALLSENDEPEAA